MLQPFLSLQSRFPLQFASSLTPLHSHNFLTPWSVFQDGLWKSVQYILGRKIAHTVFHTSNSMISSLLTLLSKFFSTFPHGTCSLSISLWYLAFDEGYHHLRSTPKERYSFLTPFWLLRHLPVYHQFRPTFQLCSCVFRSLRGCANPLACSHLSYSLFARR